MDQMDPSIESMQMVLWEQRVCYGCPLQSETVPGKLRDRYSDDRCSRISRDRRNEEHNDGVRDDETGIYPEHSLLQKLADNFASISTGCDQETADNKETGDRNAPKRCLPSESIERLVLFAAFTKRPRVRKYDQTCKQKSQEIEVIRSPGECNRWGSRFYIRHGSCLTSHGS